MLRSIGVHVGLALGIGFVFGFAYLAGCYFQSGAFLGGLTSWPLLIYKSIALVDSFFLGGAVGCGWKTAQCSTDGLIGRQ